MSKAVKPFPFIPFNDQVVVLVDESPDKIGHVHIPASAKKVLQTAVVIAVGPGGFLPNGERAKMSSEVGQHIYLKKFTGHPINVNGKDYMVMSEEQILGGLTAEYVAEFEALKDRVNKIDDGPAIPDITDAGSMTA